MDQRHVTVAIEALLPGGGGSPTGVQLMAPPNRFHAPRGRYMMFAVTKAGVPSIARWVELKP